ncbi:MAG: hypothetical protein ABSG78_07670 [Verrucomicrobiota bacterium]
MRNKVISLMSGLSLVAGLAVGPAVLASDSADVTKALAGSTALELPAKAANLVAKASAADKKNVAVAAVKAAVALNPSAATDIVSAVARENPAMAPVAAVTAATLQHKQIGLIAKAAAAAAPSEAGKIVAALIKEFPKDYGVIAIAAAEGAPSAGREILAVVAEYVPALQALIQGATANNGNVAVLAIISQALASGFAVSTTVPQPTQPAAPIIPSLSAPVITPAPFVPLGTVITYTTTTLEPTGPRSYSH